MVNKHIHERSDVMTKAFCETEYSGHKNLIGAELVNNSTLLGR